MADKVKIPNLSISFQNYEPSELQLGIIQLLIKKGPMIRRDIMTELNIPWTTAYDNLKILLQRQIVERYPKKNGKKGRSFVYWKIKNWEGFQN